MAKIKILGNSLTIKSDVKYDNIMKVSKVFPEYLQLISASPLPPYNTEVVFAVGVTEGVGNITPSGVCFDSKDADGKAYLTLAINRDPEMDKDFFANKFMTEMIRLNEVEARIKEAMDLVNQSIEAVTKDVEFIG